MHDTSPDAPDNCDVLGTGQLSMLAGQRRYVRITTLVLN